MCESHTRLKTHFKNMNQTSSIYLKTWTKQTLYFSWQGNDIACSIKTNLWSTYFIKKKFMIDLDFCDFRFLLFIIFMKCDTVVKPNNIKHVSPNLNRPMHKLRLQSQPNVNFSKSIHFLILHKPNLKFWYHDTRIYIHFSRSLGIVLGF